MAKIKFDVHNRFTGAVQFTAEIECDKNAPESVKLGLAVLWGAKNGAYLSRANLADADLSRADLADADLSGADLSGADLSRADLADADLSRADLSRADLADADLSRADLADADLSRADLSGAYLSGADLSRADLADADLSGADLADAYLSRADLSRAYLSGADLSRADLSRADLADADLSRADLSRADLSRANLSRANLSRADLSRANLSDAKNTGLIIARTRILPEGDLIGWKKCRGDVIAKLRIPADAKRSHAFGRKCRAEYAECLEVIGAEVGASLHDSKTEYRPGSRIACDTWCDDWQQECAGGIHFYITREEAEAHS